MFLHLQNITNPDQLVPPNYYKVKYAIKNASNVYVVPPSRVTTVQSISGGTLKNGGKIHYSQPRTASNIVVTYTFQYSNSLKKGDLIQLSLPYFSGNSPSISLDKSDCGKQVFSITEVGRDANFLLRINMESRELQAGTKCSISVLGVFSPWKALDYRFYPISPFVFSIKWRPSSLYAHVANTPCSRN